MWIPLSPADWARGTTTAPADSRLSFLADGQPIRSGRLAVCGPDPGEAKDQGAKGGSGPVGPGVFEARGPQVGGTELGAEYDGAELDGAGLDGAGLDGAGLDGAGLDGAGLDGAGLDGAGLDGAGLDGARLDAAAGEPVQTILTGAGAVWTIVGPVSAIVEPHGAIVGAARAVARGGAGETWLVWGLGLFSSLSGSAGTAE